MFGRTMFALAMVVPLLSSGVAKPTSPKDLERLTIQYAVVYKYDGNQPIDVVAKVVDINGDPVDDATVTAAYAENQSISTLKSLGKGFYASCAIGVAPGRPLVTISAVKSGTMPAKLAAKPKPGKLCANESPNS